MYTNNFKKESGYQVPDNYKAISKKSRVIISIAICASTLAIHGLVKSSVESDLGKTKIAYASEVSGISAIATEAIMQDIEPTTTEAKIEVLNTTKKKKQPSLEKTVAKVRKKAGSWFCIPSDWSSEFKAYEPADATTDTTSRQWALLHCKKYKTSKKGLCMVNGRYLVAMGTGFAGTEIGTKIDIILTDGTLIPCILGDVKKNKDTLGNNMQCCSNGSILEFMVDRPTFYSQKDSSGTVNWVNSTWENKIKYVVVLKEKVNCNTGKTIK